jgi:hypothetical protein
MSTSGIGAVHKTGYRNYEANNEIRPREFLHHLPHFALAHAPGRRLLLFVSFRDSDSVPDSVPSLSVFTLPVFDSILVDVGGPRVFPAPQMLAIFAWRNSSRPCETTTSSRAPPPGAPAFAYPSFPPLASGVLRHYRAHSTLVSAPPLRAQASPRFLLSRLFVFASRYVPTPPLRFEADGP